MRNRNTLRICPSLGPALIALLAVPVLLTSAAYGQVVASFPFDNSSEVDSWSIVGTNPSAIAHRSTEDVGGTPPGSMGLINSSTIAFGSSQFQLCLTNTQPGMAFKVTMAAKMLVGEMESANVGVVVNSASGSDCFGAFTSLLSSGLVIPVVANAGTWIGASASTIVVPADSQSVSLRIFVTKVEDTGSFEVLIDDVLIERSDIFADGFESGDTIAW